MEPTDIPQRHRKSGKPHNAGTGKARSPAVPKQGRRDKTHLVSVPSNLRLPQGVHASNARASRTWPLAQIPVAQNKGRRHKPHLVSAPSNLEVRHMPQTTLPPNQPDRRGSKQSEPVHKAVAGTEGTVPYMRRHEECHAESRTNCGGDEAAVSLH